MSRPHFLEVEDLKDQLAAAQREIDELKDLANGLIAFAREMLPICPDKARKMMEYATERGREMRSNATAEVERLKEECGIDQQNAAASQREAVQLLDEVERLKAELAEFTRTEPMKVQERNEYRDRAWKAEAERDRMREALENVKSSLLWGEEKEVGPIIEAALAGAGEGE